jgi:acetyltransferase-like isoleucine patch superfamily enzyme
MSGEVAAERIGAMSVGARLRRSGFVGLSFKLSSIYWRLKSQFYYGPQFAAFGVRSRIRKPILIRNPGGMSFGDNCFIRDGARLEVVDRPGLPPGRLVIGHGVSMEQGVHIAACDDITIGDYACFAANCAILDTRHPEGTSDGENRVWEVSGERSFVHIGRRVFLGVNVVVLPNVSIGDNSIIGAGSVVTQSIPANSIAVGAPAKVIRTLAE